MTDTICLFIMLNPSTADEESNDPTIRRCMGFARSWGYGVLEVANLFALRATDPRVLRPPLRKDEPIGVRTDSYLMEAARRADLVVAAWGAWGTLWGRGRGVLDMLKGAGIRVATFGLTKQGEPRHPLYLPKDALLDGKGEGVRR